MGGSGCEEWNTTTSPSCFTPNGFPSPSDSFSLPSNTTMKITCGINMTGPGNSISHVVFHYGPSCAIFVDSFSVSSNANLIIGTYLCLDISSSSSISPQGTVTLEGVLAAIGGEGDLTVGGNITIQGGNMQGSGFLMVEENAFLILDFGYGDNFLLRNSSIYGQMIQTSPDTVTHTGFWWQEGEVIIQIFGNLTLGGSFYNWELSGELFIGKGGIFSTTTELIGLKMTNNGTLLLDSQSYLYTLSSSIVNHALIRVKSGGLPIQITNNGVIYASDYLTLANSLVDNHGVFVSDFSTITFQAGEMIYIYYCCGTYYGASEEWGETYEEYDPNLIQLNGTTLTGSGLFDINSPITIIDNLYIIDTFVHCTVYYTYFFNMGGNIHIDKTSNFNLQEGNILAEKDYSINVFGTFEVSSATNSTLSANLNIGTGGNFTLAISSDGNFTLIQNETFHYAVYLSGNFTITGNLISNINFYLFNGSFLVINEKGQLNLVNNAKVIICGGAIDNNGVINGPAAPCPFSDLENDVNYLYHKRVLENSKLSLLHRKENLNKRLDEFPHLHSYL